MQRGIHSGPVIIHTVVVTNHSRNPERAIPASAISHLLAYLVYHLFFFFLESIIVHLRVQNPTWHFSGVHDNDT